MGKGNGVRKKLEKKEKSKTFRCSKLLSLQTVLYLIFSLGVLYPVTPKGFAINSLGDDGDANSGDAVCETGPGIGICTQRAASQEAEALFLTQTLILPNNAYNVLQIRDLPRRFENSKDLIINSAAAVTVYGRALEQTSERKAGHCVYLQSDRGPPSI